MATLNIKDDLHVRIRKLIVDTGGTIGDFAHQALEKAVTAGETKLAKVREKANLK